MGKLLQLLMVTGGLGLSGLLTIPFLPDAGQDRQPHAQQNTGKRMQHICEEMTSKFEDIEY